LLTLTLYVPDASPSKRTWPGGTQVEVKVKATSEMFGVEVDVVVERLAR
jgi:hypothetical protein